MSIARPFFRRSFGLIKSTQLVNPSSSQRPSSTAMLLSLARPIQTFPPLESAKAAAAQGKKPPSALAQLRKKTGYSLSLCKKALAENGQDVGKAKTWLEEQAQAQGWNKANKLEGRNTTQGLVGLQVSACGTAAAMVELNSETDFVARNKQFHVLLNAIVDVCLKQAQQLVHEDGKEVVAVTSLRKADLANLNVAAKEAGGNTKTLADLVALNIGQIGENLTLRRAVLFKVNKEAVDPNVEEVKLSALTHPSANIHSSDSVAYGRFGSILAYAKDKQRSGEPVLPEGQTVESLARQICQHVIGMNPTSVGDPSESETVAAADESSKPMAVEEPKGEGVQADEDWSQYQDEPSAGNNNSTELVHQALLTNPSVSVKEVILEAAIDIKRFARFEVGQTLDQE